MRLKMTQDQFMIAAPFLVLFAYVFVQGMLYILAHQRDVAITRHDTIRAAQQMRADYVNSVTTRAEAIGAQTETLASRSKSRSSSNSATPSAQPDAFQDPAINVDLVPDDELQQAA